jgi:endoglucanase
LVLHVAEDAWNGDAHFVLLVDGQVETPEIAVTWAHSTGTFHDFYVGGTWSDAPHRVEIRFIDDAWGGSPDMDRNLYIGGITYNGQFYAGQLAENTAQNGQPDADPNAAEMYVNGSVIFHHVGAEPAPPPPPPPPPPDDSGSSSLSIRVAEDAWNGDAQFIVKVDGTQFGGIQTATASHSAGQWQDIAIDGALSAGPHTIAIDFLNDAWGGTPDTDRNLYIQSVTLNGETISGATADNNAANGMSTADPSAAVMAINGTSTFHTIGTGGGDTGPTSTIVLHLSEDAWNGDAQFKVLVNGNETSDIRSVAASHADHAVEDVTITGAFGSSGPSVIDVVFLNDAWGGSADTDRNLYVQSVDINGVHFDGNTAINNAANGGESTDQMAAVMDINGTASFHIDHNAPPLLL